MKQEAILLSVFLFTRYVFLSSTPLPPANVRKQSRPPPLRSALGLNIIHSLPRNEGDLMKYGV
jgi:hypothetical protein